MPIWKAGACRDMEERRRRKIILTSLILFTVLFFGFMMITRIADASDFSKQQSPSGKESCSTAPKHPQDRRKDKTKFSFMNYNAEWLFLNGGSGSMKCPGTCTWKVSSFNFRTMQKPLSISRIL